jgi:hypothetical protein
MVGYRKLRTGDYGAQGPINEVPTHGTVTVTKKNGFQETRRVQRVLWEGDGLRLVSLFPQPRPPRRGNGHANGHAGNGHAAPAVVQAAPAEYLWRVLDVGGIVGTLPAPTLEAARQAAGERWGHDLVESGELRVLKVPAPAPQPAPVAAFAKPVEGPPPPATPELESPWLPPVEGHHERLAEKYGSDLVQFEYDIPKAARVASPRDWGRNRFFWTSNSMMVGMRRDVPLVWVDNFNRELHRLRQTDPNFRGKWKCRPLHPAAVPQVLAEAQEYFIDEAAKEKASLVASIALVTTKLDAAQAEAEANGEEFDREKAARAYLTTARSLAKAKAKVIEGLAEAARHFGLADQAGSALEKARNSIEGLTAYFTAKAEAYRSLKEMAVGTAMEAAANAGEIDGSILADFLEDETGRDMSGYRNVLND